MEGSTEDSDSSVTRLVLENQVTEFIADKRPIELLQPVAGSLLAHDSIVPVIEGIHHKLQKRFVEKVDEVRDSYRP